MKQIVFFKKTLSPSLERGGKYTRERNSERRLVGTFNEPLSEREKKRGRNITLSVYNKMKNFLP
uniref:Uncharacterized protein n=1 Tax=Lepeophtheirus salmonis TaxID=72036 RepID=A0A0K2TCP2_LEPSM